MIRTTTTTTAHALRFTLYKFAKTGRAKCKKCKELMAKDDMRIGTTVTGGACGYDLVIWNHPKCFTLPRKFTTGAGKITPEQFVEDVLEDSSVAGEILPAKAEELAAAIGAKFVKPKTAETTTSMTELRDAYEARLREQEEGKPPASKKLKSDDTARLDAYGKYHRMKAIELTDVLQWNKQFKTGNKDYLMEKVIDGEVNGRLATVCALCLGHLKLMEGGTTVKCNGGFDEDTQTRQDCAFTGEPSTVPRWKPWYV
jgi:hypothetical protein